jgi:endo-1,3(4)-beta-glucanase
MDTQAGAWLFWGAERIQIAAIQILPLTPMGMYTYNRDWLVDVLPYCKEELDDPEKGDAFKSGTFNCTLRTVEDLCSFLFYENIAFPVIYAAHAKINPQEAAAYSSNLFDWGTGNSATNQLYFVATQQSAADICSSTTQTPKGTFTIQDVTSGRFVTVGGDGHLAASIGADVLATPFALRFTPGGGTIQSLSNEKYVTASPDGTGAISAIRDSPQSYEVFRWDLGVN